jgi:electron transfer flavoprotein alpha subunit
MSVLAILEHNGGAWHRLSMETLAAAQQLAAGLGATASAALVGADTATLAAGLGDRQLERIYRVEHPLLAVYTADGWTAALEQLLALAKPEYVVTAHTYQVRDYFPKLAAGLGVSAVTDAVGFRVEDGKAVVVRQLFQGKVNADVRFTGAGPHLISVQAGAFRSDAVLAGSAAVERFEPQIAPEAVRTIPEAPFREGDRAVDLSAAEAIVAVGRGIKEADNLPLIEALAAALGAEIAASRPICDAGWLPLDRQVGSSGQTVAPKLYVAVGISGAIQHLVGMKGSRTIVAVNKDANAPIFESADYGIVGDLFEVVPEITAAVKRSK